MQCENARTPSFKQEIIVPRNFSRVGRILRSVKNHVYKILAMYVFLRMIDRLGQSLL